MNQTSGGGNPQKRESPTANWANSGNPQSGADTYDYTTSVDKVDEIIRRRVRLYQTRLWIDYINSVLEN